MTGRQIPILAAAALAAACGGPPPDPERSEFGAAERRFEAVETEGAFRDRVVGRDIVYMDGVVLRLTPDGGFVAPEAFEAEGSWRWEDGRYCRALTFGPREIAEACRTPEISEDGTRIRFRHPDGGYSRVAELR